MLAKAAVRHEGEAAARRRERGHIAARTAP